MNLLNKIARDTRAVPMLTLEQERDLVARAKAGDRRALDRLIRAHARLALACATKMRHYGFPVEDLYQEGCVGLMRAAEKFDPARGLRFATCAIWWVRSAIQDYVLRNTSVVRIGTTAAQKALFFQGRAARAQLLAEKPDATDGEVNSALAARFNLPLGDVERILGALSAGDWHLDTLIDPTVGGESFLDRLADERPLVDEVLGDDAVTRRRRVALDRAQDDLSDRERDIFRRRMLAEEPETLEDLGAEYGISKERIRQLGVRAFDKVAAGVRREVLA